MTNIEDITDVSEIDGSLGLAGLIASRTRSLHEEIKSAKETSRRLMEDLEDVTRPKIVVEGVTDQSHFELAYRKLYERECPWAVSPGSNAESVLQFCLGLHRVGANGPPVFGVVDYDSEGRKVIDKAEKFRNDSEFGDLRVIDRASKVYLTSLPLPDHFAQISDAIGKDNIQLCVEFMYPPDIIGQAEEDGALILIDWVQSVNSGTFREEFNFTEKFSDKLAPELIPYMRRLDDGCKMAFIDWLETKEAEVFEGFRPIFQMIETILDRQ